jgi:hypothetical protein
MKAYTEGVRALILYASYCIDRGRIAHNTQEKAAWASRAAFLTPVAKAYGSDLSFRVTEVAMQVYGGYGYMKDYPIEQFLRDEKVHSIFEGTNGIQALDLAGRKLGRDNAELHKGLLADITQFCNENKGHQTLAPYIKILESANKALDATSTFLAEIQKKDFPLLALYAYPYLELFGDVTVGWLLIWQAVIAHAKLAKLAEGKGVSEPAGMAKLVADNAEAAFYSGKEASARFFVMNMLGLAVAKAHAIQTGDRAALDIAENCFQ